ncbi:SDR family NAD(P)-dependent oxidoreductase [Thermodesulfobacteriota bacterium]
MRFKDKVAVITGGTSGMGEAAVLGFVREGASVVVNDINEERLEGIAEKIQSMGGDVLTVHGDITKKETISRMVNDAIDKYNKIDILFNYVGGEPDLGPHTSFMEQSTDFWDRMIDLNLKSTMLACQAVLGKMIKRRYGKIINTGAIAGKVGALHMVPYSAVKGGIIALTKALAMEMAPYKINVNCVCPGPIETPGFRKIFNGIDDGVAADVTALKRIGKPEEVASAVLYLASDEAAFITGQAFSIDGGATMI